MSLLPLLIQRRRRGVRISGVPGVIRREQKLRKLQTLHSAKPLTPNPSPLKRKGRGEQSQKEVGKQSLLPIDAVICSIDCLIRLQFSERTRRIDH